MAYCGMVMYLFLIHGDAKFMMIKMGLKMVEVCRL